MSTVLLISTILLLFEELFIIFNFQYSYYLELKSRFVLVNKNLPMQYLQKLRSEVQNEINWFRKFTHIINLPWIILCLFTKVWFIPLSIIAFLFFSNIFYRKAYISPIMYLLTHIFAASAYIFVLISLYMKLV